MKSVLLTWAPVLLLAGGTVFTNGIDRQQRLPLREPLGAAVPVQLEGTTGQDVTISDEEIRVAGMSDYLMRTYGNTDEGYAFSVYVGYYDQQMQGRTIHSPKNCLPGSGWEALASTRHTVQTAEGRVEVNRYLLKREDQSAVVFYWYQGRGRVEANEYVVKWNLLRDAALRSRSDEALVRVVVPIRAAGDEEAELASRVAALLIPAVGRALPE